MWLDQPLTFLEGREDGLFRGALFLDRLPVFLLPAFVFLLVLGLELVCSPFPGKAMSA